MGFKIWDVPTVEMFLSFSALAILPMYHHYVHTTICRKTRAQGVKPSSIKGERRVLFGSHCQLPKTACVMYVPS